MFFQCFIINYFLLKVLIIVSAKDFINLITIINCINFITMMKKEVRHFNNFFRIPIIIFIIINLYTITDVLSLILISQICYKLCTFTIIATHYCLI